MAARRPFVLVFAAALASMGASYPTANFVVEAPNPQVAEQVGQWAEYYRKEKALQWLGHEMPQWSERCPIHVKVTMGGAGGATSFNFSQGHVWQTMQIEGPLDRLLASVLPHEVTHTVFAYYFRCPVPRWADEGGAVLSEDDLERNRHDQMTRQILNSGRAIPLARLFALRDYPREVGSLYAEGYSVSNFLVSSSNRQTFLKFVAHGMQYGWDSASQNYYRYPNVNALERAWLEHLASTRRQPQTLLARNEAAPGTTADPAKRVVVRLTAPPAPPLPEAPAAVYRGQAPEYDLATGSAFGATSQTGARTPGYLPDYTSPGPGSRPQSNPSGVRLGVPRFDQPK